MGAKRVTIEIGVGPNSTRITKLVETKRKWDEDPTFEELNNALCEIFEDAKFSIIKENN